MLNLKVNDPLNRGDWGCIVRDLDYHSLGLTRIQFHPLKVTPRIQFDEVTVQGLCYRNLNAWGWHNSYQN